MLTLKLFEKIKTYFQSKRVKICYVGLANVVGIKYHYAYQTPKYRLVIHTTHCITYLFTFQLKTIVLCTTNAYTFFSVVDQVPATLPLRHVRTRGRRPARLVEDATSYEGDGSIHCGRLARWLCRSYICAVRGWRYNIIKCRVKLLWRQQWLDSIKLKKI